MHTLFTDKYWEQECFTDGSEDLTRRLWALAKEYNIPLSDLKIRFPELISEENVLRDCGIVVYSNSVKRDSVRIKILFDERSHNDTVSVDVFVVKKYGSVRETIYSVDRFFSGYSCKKQASEFCNEWVSRLEEEFLK